MLHEPQLESVEFPDDGVFPNSVLPLLVYRQAVPANPGEIEKLFGSNQWTNSWRNGVYPFPHYHSTSHEVLAVYRGTARLQFGGPKVGREFEVRAGDIVVIPAGVAHQKLSGGEDFAVVGAYPDGRDWDLLRGTAGERPLADENIKRVPLPRLHPLFGPGIPCWG